MKIKHSFKVSLKPMSSLDFYVRLAKSNSHLVISEDTPPIEDRLSKAL